MSPQGCVCKCEPVGQAMGGFKSSLCLGLEGQGKAGMQEQPGRPWRSRQKRAEQPDTICGRALLWPHLGEGEILGLPGLHAGARAPPTGAHRQSASLPVAGCPHLPALTWPTAAPMLPAPSTIPVTVARASLLPWTSSWRPRSAEMAELIMFEGPPMKNPDGTHGSGSRPDRCSQPPPLTISSPGFCPGAESGHWRVAGDGWFVRGGNWSTDHLKWPLLFWFLLKS